MTDENIGNERLEEASKGNMMQERPLDDRKTAAAGSNPLPAASAGGRSRRDSSQNYRETGKQDSHQHAPVAMRITSH